VAWGILTASLVAFPVSGVPTGSESAVDALSPETAGFKGLEVISFVAMGYELVGEVDAGSRAAFASAGWLVSREEVLVASTRGDSRTGDVPCPPRPGALIGMPLVEVARLEGGEAWGMLVHAILCGKGIVCICDQ
jgi:hypothetical protein